MNKYKNVHIINNDKFIKAFIDFINENFNKNEHLFIFIDSGNEKCFPIPKADNIININYSFEKKASIITLSKKVTHYFEEAEKVILHSLFAHNLINYLYLNKKFLKKCYWVIWGGDLYSYINSKKTLLNFFNRYMKKRVIKKMGHFVTYIKGDYELAKKWYGAKGEYHECFMYPSNLYKKYAVNERDHKSVNILVGNSADTTNNHMEIFEKLEKYKNENINIYVPLSYGNQEYAKSIIKIGTEIFGEKFKPMTDFMSFDKYLEFLKDIDIAIFNHNRQQAMGNIITLLGLGKKVYLRSDITPWALFKNIGVKVFDIEGIDLKLFQKEEKQLNQQKVKEYFSEENYFKQLKQLYES